MSYPLMSTQQLRQILLSARKSQKLSQSELAARVGLSQSRISQMELQPDTITAQQLLQLASVLDLEMVLRPRRSAELTVTPAARQPTTGTTPTAGADW